MKSKDIEPGVVYGYRRGKYGAILPVVFLAPPGPGQLYAERTYRKDGELLFQHRPNVGKPQQGRSIDPSIGYPVVFGHGSDVDLAALAAQTLAGFQAATTRSVGEFSYDVLVTIAHVLGPYEEAKAQADAEKQAEREKWDAERKAADAAWERAEQQKQALARRGITATIQAGRQPTALEIPLDDVDTLLRLLNTER